MIDITSTTVQQGEDLDTLALNHKALCLVRDTVGTMRPVHLGVTYNQLLQQVRITYGYVNEDGAMVGPVVRVHGPSLAAPGSATVEEATVSWSSPLNSTGYDADKFGLLLVAASVLVSWLNVEHQPVVKETK